MYGWLKEAFGIFCLGKTCGGIFCLAACFPLYNVSICYEHVLWLHSQLGDDAGLDETDVDVGLAKTDTNNGLTKQDSGEDLRDRQFCIRLLCEYEGVRMMLIQLVVFSD